MMMMMMSAEPAPEMNNYRVVVHDYGPQWQAYENFSFAPSWVKKFK